MKVQKNRTSRFPSIRLRSKPILRITSHRSFVLAATLATCAAASAGAAAAQSSASTYSYGTYNPVQAAINRNSMNAAILRQATGGHAKTAHTETVKSKRTRGR